MSLVLALLNEMRLRPLAIFIGEKSITKLAAYLRGYEHAVETVTGARDEFLGNFREWIEVRLRDRSHGWENAIILRSKDEADAVDHFWRLLDEFLAAHPELGAQSASALAGPAVPNGNMSAIPVGHNRD